MGLQTLLVIMGLQTLLVIMGLHWSNYDSLKVELTLAVNATCDNGPPLEEL